MQVRRLRHKFGAKKVITKEGTFASTAEYQFRLHLDELKQKGEVLFYLSQVPIRLPGKTKLVIDYVVFYEDGEIEFIDIKGVETDAFKIKKREIEAVYPFTIIRIKKRIVSRKTKEIAWDRLD